MLEPYHRSGRSRHRLLVVLLGADRARGGRSGRVAAPAARRLSGHDAGAGAGQHRGARSSSPLEIERQVTAPVEQAISGLPRLTEVRSLTRFGLSQVTVIFEDGTDIYLARQVVAERI